MKSLWMVPLILLSCCALNLSAEDSTPPVDPTYDSRLTISDWEKAAMDLTESLKPTNDAGERAALDRFKVNLDPNKDSTMEPAELLFALRELQHGHPDLENRVRRKIRENNPITPK